MKRSAFTLVELLVVIAIIGLLSAATFVGFTQQQRRARDTRRIADGSSLGIAIEAFRSEKGKYPDSLIGTDPRTNTVNGNSYTWTPSTSANTGVPIQSDLSILVDLGLLNTLPSDPKLPTGIPAALSGTDPTFCVGYTYTQSDISANNLYNNWKNAGHPELGNRAWVVYIPTEMPPALVGPTNTYAHVADSTIPANDIGWCQGSTSAAQRGYAYILGPKKP